MLLSNEIIEVFVKLYIIECWSYHNNGRNNISVAKPSWSYADLQCELELNS